MLITKFNRLIRNKFLWAVVAIVVSVSFVLSASSLKGCAKDTAAMAGQLYGEDISMQQFRLTRFFELGMRPNTDLSPEANLRLHHRTWQRLAMLRTADRLGITTSIDEVGRLIRKDPSFAVNGAFSKDHYRSVISEQLRVDIATFEIFLRQNVTLMKLRGIMGSLVWVSPQELNQRLANLTDKRRVEYATFTASNLVGDINVTDEDARAFYEENDELFTLPRQVSVRYVMFPITNFFSTNLVSEADIQEHYDRHIDDYTPTDTNGMAFPTPLEEVGDEIAELLKIRAATSKQRISPRIS